MHVSHIVIVITMTIAVMLYNACLRFVDCVLFLIGSAYFVAGSYPADGEELLHEHDASDNPVAPGYVPSSGHGSVSSMSITSVEEAAVAPTSAAASASASAVMTSEHLLIHQSGGGGRDEVV